MRVGLAVPRRRNVGVRAVEYRDRLDRPRTCCQCGFARAKWPISVPCGSQPGTSSSGRCDTSGSGAAGVTSVANGCSCIRRAMAARSCMAKCGRCVQAHQRVSIACRCRLRARTARAPRPAQRHICGCRTRTSLRRRRARRGSTRFRQGRRSAAPFRRAPANRSSGSHGARPEYAHVVVRETIRRATPAARPATTAWPVRPARCSVSAPAQASSGRAHHRRRHRAAAAREGPQPGPHRSPAQGGSRVAPMSQGSAR